MAGLAAPVRKAGVTPGGAGCPGRSLTFQGSRRVLAADPAGWPPGRGRGGDRDIAGDAVLRHPPADPAELLVHLAVDHLVGPVALAADPRQPVLHRAQPASGFR